jgi:hypothetical protein
MSGGLTEKLLQQRSSQNIEKKWKIRSFEIIHDRYLVINFKTEIYFMDLTVADGKLQGIDIELNEGSITQILQTGSCKMI